MRYSRERPFAHDVALGGKHRQHVRLVEMVRRRDDHRVETLELEQVFDVGQRVGNPESIGQRSRWQIAQP